jgi:hypothetical protein
MYLRRTPQQFAEGKVMYVYIESEKGTLWTVGFYDPKGNWQPESDHTSSIAAAERVHFLNGDTPPIPQPCQCAEDVT